MLLGGSRTEEHDVPLQVAAPGGGQLQLLGHHLTAEPEADRQHLAHPTLADAAAQLAAAGHPIAGHCGARLGQNHLTVTDCTRRS